MKKRITVFVIALAFLGLAGASVGVDDADALCNKFVKTARIYSATNGWVYFYGANWTTYPTYYYYWRTNSSTIKEELTAAAGTNQTLYVSGDRSSCPSSGVLRYGGNVRYTYRYSNY